MSLDQKIKSKREELKDNKVRPEEGKKLLLKQETKFSGNV